MGDSALSMKFLLIGRTGQLGWELERSLTPLGAVTALSHRELDLQDPDQIRAVVRAAAPDIMLNCAAYTAVDQAEAEPGLAFDINARAPGILAEEALRQRAFLIHFSTDYVFDGAKGTPYDEEDAARPLSAYGRSKWAGEQAIAASGVPHLILRTGWLYSLRRRCFVTQVLEWARARPDLRIAEDQVGSPTWSRMVAEATSLLLRSGMDDVGGYLRERSGLYHLTSDGAVSRFEWARAILHFDPHPAQQRTTAATLRPARRTDFPAAAERPANSALDCRLFRTTFGVSLPRWDLALRLAMEAE